MATKSKAVVPLVFFALFWNGIVWTFDAVIGYQLYRVQDARSRYEEVEARVVSSSVRANHSSDGSTYAPSIEFLYEFDGMTFRSDRHAFLSIATSDRGFATAACERFPVGAEVTAFVDPEDPMEAVLDLSGKSFPAMLLLFLTPFNLIGLSILGMIFNTLRRPEEKSADDELRERYIVVDTGDHVVFGKARMPAPMVALISMTALTFLACFALVPFQGIGASLTSVVTALLICVLVSVSFAAWRVKKGKAPENFLHVDRTRNTFSYPANAPGEPLESIQSILHQPEATGVTINDVRQYKHRFEAETPDGVVKLFEVRTGEDEGDKLLRLLRTELRKG
ncbi:DUF3592 domain-containing protein [Saltatorellus ferox]